MRHARSYYLLSLLIVMFGTATLWADVTGSIQGFVRDQSGAVVPNASVDIVELATGYQRTVTSNASGQYTVLGLPPGHYQLIASAGNFQKEVIDRVELNVNDTLHFDFVLRV